MSAEVTEIINTLCEKLGVAANVLVPEMARYYIARLVFLTLIETIFAIIVAIVFAKIVRWILRESDADWDDRIPMLFFRKSDSWNSADNSIHFCGFKCSRPHRMDCISDSISS